MSKLSESKLNLRLNPIKVFQKAFLWFIPPLVIVFIMLVCGTVYATGGNQYDGFANIGIDFQGGTVLSVEMIGADLINQNLDKNTEIITKLIEEKGLTSNQPQTSGSNTLVFRYANSVNGTSYNTKEKTAEMIEINNSLAREIERILTAEYSSQKVEVSASPELISASASSDLIKKAILSVSIALLLIVLYIIFRFDLFSGLAAILALMHDILIMFAGVIIFRIPINSMFIAGIITIVSYSINNTIIVFDRVRDYMKPYKTNKQRVDVASVVNGSVANTLTRSILTTLTTLITLVVLAGVGVQSLTEFALPIIFGLLAGAYSSLFIAPTIWGLFQQSKIDRAKKNAKGGSGNKSVTQQAHKAKKKKARA